MLSIRSDLPAEAKQSTVKKLLDFNLYVDHILKLDGRIYYSIKNEIWTVDSTGSYSLSKQLWEAKDYVTELFLHDGKVCYKTGDQIHDLETEVKLSPPIKRPAAILTSANSLPSIYPVSLSGRHFAAASSHNDSCLNLLIITEENTIKLIKYTDYLSTDIFSSAYCISMLSHDNNTFVLTGRYGLQIFKFSSSEITLLGSIKFEVEEELRNKEAHAWTYLKKGISLQDERHIIFTNNRVINLVDTKYSTIRTLTAGNNPRLYWSSIGFSAPYLIFCGDDKILLFDVKKATDADFLKVPDLQFDFKGAVNVMPWPYDSEQGQLWAVAYGDERDARLMLVKFKIGESLEKIADIERRTIVDPQSLLIANDQLFYRRFDQLVAYDPATKEENEIDARDIPTSLKQMIKGVGTPLGVISGNPSQLFFDPYPVTAQNKINRDTEFGMIYNTLNKFPVPLINLITGYLDITNARLGTGCTLPPPEIKRSEEDTRILEKLDALILKVKNHKQIFEALSQLKTKLLCRTLSFNECIDITENTCQILLAGKQKKVKFLYRHFDSNYALQFEISQFLQELRHYDKAVRMIL
ncbi:MAG: hypothetical protein ACYCQI_02100 [Gammaproteobacteria bacterium]